ncbi:thioredoxin [Nitzschia inconspicua]|uniref:Thioredoxin n=1 Tax=Nitzschia inconspicua TaxID=303405 RepID=A0A9K3KLM2_9STRA|nr:thioredoxin [Nitzschia inconspicua]
MTNVSGRCRSLLRSPFLIVFIVVTVFSSHHVVAAAAAKKNEYPQGQVHGTPIDLTKETFPQALEDPMNKFWFFKFYAPWCGHCKRMTPVLQTIAPKVKGKMAIGKIDCTKQKPLCNEYGVRGFPTLMYSINGEFFDYHGGRDEKSLLKFAEKMSSPPITTVKRLEEATRFSMTKTDDGVAFLASDKTKESSKLYEIFEQVARKNQASVHFLWMTQSVNDADNGIESAYISRVEAGVVEPRYYDLNGDDALTVEKVEAWIHDFNVPTIVTLGPDNFSRISKKKRPLVMALVDLDNQELVEGTRKHMMDFVLTTPQETVDKYYYGLFDGKKWQKFLEQFHVKPEDNPQYLVLDMPNKKYWRNETYTKLKDFLIAVYDGSIEAKTPDKTGMGDTPFAWIAEKFMAYFPYSLGPVVILFCLIIILVTPSKEEFQSRVPQRDVDDDVDDEDDDDGAEEKETSDDDNNNKGEQIESKKDK